MNVAEKVLSFPIKKAPLLKVNDPLLERNKITLYIRREDLIHPYIFGNKWHKLKYNLIEAEQPEKENAAYFRWGLFKPYICHRRGRPPFRF